MKQNELKWIQICTALCFMVCENYSKLHWHRVLMLSENFHTINQGYTELDSTPRINNSMLKIKFVCDGQWRGRPRFQDKHSSLQLSGLSIMTSLSGHKHSHWLHSVHSIIAAIIILNWITSNSNDLVCI